MSTANRASPSVRSTGTVADSITPIFSLLFFKKTLFVYFFGLLLFPIFSQLFDDIRFQNPGSKYQVNHPIESLDIYK